MLTSLLLISAVCAQPTVPRKDPAFARARLLTVVAAAANVAGWGVFVSEQNSPGGRIGETMISVSLPLATLGTFAEANALERMGLRPNRTAATAALPLWAVGVGEKGRYGGVSGMDQVQGIAWLGLNVGSLGLTVTQFVVNEARFRKAGTDQEATAVPMRLGIAAAPNMAVLRVSGGF